MDERHFIFGTQPQGTSESKEVKLHLPIGHLIRLHGLKLLTGQNISDTVAKALDAYFQEVEAQRSAARLAAQSVPA